MGYVISIVLQGLWGNAGVLTASPLAPDSPLDPGAPASPWHKDKCIQFTHKHNIFSLMSKENANEFNEINQSYIKKSTFGGIM